MMPTLPSLSTTEAVIMTTSGAAINGKVGTMAIRVFQRYVTVQRKPVLININDI